MAKKAVELHGSDKPLIFPDGSVEESVLEGLLYDALDTGVKNEELVVVIYPRRVRDFDENNPEWEDVESKMPLVRLLGIYKRINRRDYVKPPREVYEDSLKRRKY